MGILYLSAILIIWIAYKISEKYYDYKSMKRTMTWYGTYNTRDGRTVDTRSGKYVRWYRDKNWDFIITNCLDVYRNISEEKRNIVFEQLRNNHPEKMTVLSWNLINRHEDADIKGIRCRDFETGRFYVARSVSRGYGAEIDFYVDAETGQFIRRTDRQMERDKWSEDNDFVKKVIETNGKGYVINPCLAVSSPYENQEIDEEMRRV